MADEKQLELLRQGELAWNQWRRENPNVIPDLRHAELQGSQLGHCDLSAADLREARLAWADLRSTKFMSADLRGVKINDARAPYADFSDSKLQNSYLWGSDFREAVFCRADLSGANLMCAQLIRADFTDANLTGCQVYGTSAWEVKLERTKQHSLVITPPNTPGDLSVEDLQVAQFVFLLLRNEKIRDVIDTIGNKAVLILGRFTERKEVLEAIRGEVRRSGYLPIVFDFERPADRDLSETVMTLAGMSRFIIADITKPRSVPLELHATVPNYMIPFVPIIQEGEEPFAMFRDLRQKYGDWVLDPLSYSSVDTLVSVFDKAVIQPANARHTFLQNRKAEQLRVRHVKDYQ
jgi:uncharacterized protein YjbI with pentapeptide repeats